MKVRQADSALSISADYPSIDSSSDDEDEEEQDEADEPDVDGAESQDEEGTKSSTRLHSTC